MPCVQLRQDKRFGYAVEHWVGFQTKLKHGAAGGNLPHDPRLENAEIRRGSAGIHRNTFLNRRNCLDQQLRYEIPSRGRASREVDRRGGYVESARDGPTGRTLRPPPERLGHTIAPPPPTTALGALVLHITAGHLQAKADLPANEYQFRPASRTSKTIQDCEDGQTPCAGKDQGPGQEKKGPRPLARAGRYGCVVAGEAATVFTGGVGLHRRYSIAFMIC